MKIKTPSFKDVQTIGNLLKENFQTVNSNDYTPDQIYAWTKICSLSNIQQKIENKNLRNFLATENNQIIGFISFSTQKALLSSLYVHPQKSGQGIGTELLELAEQIIKTHGHKKLSLNSSLTAKNFYEKKGYTKQAKIDLIIEGTKIPVLQMSKELV